MVIDILLNAFIDIFFFKIPNNLSVGIVNKTTIQLIRRQLYCSANNLFVAMV